MFCEFYGVQTPSIQNLYRVHMVIQLTRPLNSIEHQLPTILVTRVVMAEREYANLPIIWHCDDVQAI